MEGCYYNQISEIEGGTSWQPRVIADSFPPLPSFYTASLLLFSDEDTGVQGGCVIHSGSHSQVKPTWNSYPWSLRAGFPREINVETEMQVKH